MPKAKIKALQTRSEKKKAPKIAPEPQLKKTRLVETKKLKKPLAIKPASVTKKIDLTPKIKELFFVTAEDCLSEGQDNEGLDPGPISEQDFNFIVDCSQVVFTLTPEGTTEMDPNFPFSNKAFLIHDKNTLVVKFELNLQNQVYRHETKVTFSPKLKNQHGEIWPLPSQAFDTEDIELSQPETFKELLSSYALSQVLQVPSKATKGAKGYFLAVYK